jgi:tetratricopeptide (TPR) repeat protein
MAKSAFETALEVHARGELGEAERLYRAHLKSDRQHAGALQGLGILLAQQGKSGDAVVLLRRALESRPGTPELHSNLGMGLVTLGRAEEAVEHFIKALAANPQFAEAHNGMGLAQAQLGRREEALDHLRRAVSIRPDFSEAHANIGLALRELGRYEEARTACEKAIAASPDNPALYVELGKVHGELGELDTAAAIYERALKAAPLRADIHRQLAQIKRYEKDDPHLAQMLALSREERLSPQARMDLDFALGKALIDAGDYERALTHLTAANAVVRQRLAYDEASTLGFLERVRTIFTEIRGPAVGDPSPLPVFVVGMPRSGTTLTEQILASHPHVFGAGELRHIENAATAVAPFPEAAGSMSAEALRELGASYVARLRALSPAATRIVDKMPANFRFIGLIHRALPNAKIIHVRRDPVDSCMSCFAQLFAGLPFAYDLGELGRYYRGYAALMAHWRQALPPEAMLEIDYERLIDDLPGEARRMIAYCGLEWDDSCLEFHKTRRPVRTASFAQVRRPIYHSSIGRWHAHREVLKPLLDALGEA